ncbi:MAG: hypothetical protein ACWGQW_04675, partial [bacterium]
MLLRDIPVNATVISKKALTSIRTSSMSSIPKGTVFKVTYKDPVDDIVTLSSRDGKYILKRPGYQRVEDYFETRLSSGTISTCSNATEALSISSEELMSNVKEAAKKIDIHARMQNSLNNILRENWRMLYDYPKGFGEMPIFGVDKAKGDEMAKKEPEAKTMINSEPEKFGYTFKSGNVDFDEIAEELSRENPILHVSVEENGKRQDSVLVHHSLLNKAELCDIKPPKLFYENVKALKDSGLYGMGHTNSKLFIGVKSYRKVWKKWVDDVINVAGH